MNLADLEARSEKVTESGCWLWTGNTSKKDWDRQLNEPKYGIIDTGKGEVRKTIPAHKAAWVALHGPVPQGKFVLHTCGVGLCVNPAHLRLGSHQDNMDDMVLHKTSTKGSKHPNHVLVEDEVKQIKADLRRGITHKALADLYGVSRSTITAISVGNSWSWL